MAKLPKIGETISAEEFNKLPAVGETITAEKFEQSPSEPQALFRTTQQQQREEPFRFSPTQTLTNIPGSAARFVGDIFQAVRHPIQTGKAVGATAIGGVERLAGLETERTKQFNQVAQFFKERYGGTENILRTLQEDPVGIAADLAGFFTGGGLIVRGAGVAGKVSALQRFGTAATRVGAAIEPLGVGAKAVGFVTRRIGGGIARETLGITTGQGGEVIKQAMRAAETPARPEFVAALRGQTDKMHILTATRDALQRLRDQRRNAYLEQFNKIKKANASLLAKQINPIKVAIAEGLKQWNIKQTKKGLNFSQSKIADTTEANRIKSVIEETIRWRNNTPIGLDTLKSRLDDFFTSSGEGRALTNKIRGAVEKVLDNNVSGYKQMTADYTRQTAFIKDIENTLSLGKGATTDTTLRKLISAIKQDVGMRNELLTYLDELTGVDIRAQLAGAALTPRIPAGLIGRGALAGAAGAILIGTINPKYIIALAGASPRLVGEFINALGFTKQQANKIIKLAIPEARVGLFQAGRIRRELLEEEPERIFNVPEIGETISEEEFLELGQ